MLIAATAKKCEMISDQRNCYLLFTSATAVAELSCIKLVHSAHHGAYSYANFDSPAVEEEKTAKIYIWKAQINVGARMSSVKMNVSAVNCELSRGKSLQQEKGTGTHETLRSFRIFISSDLLSQHFFLSCAFDKRWTRQEIIARTDNNGQTSSEWEKCMKTTCIRLDEFRRIKFRKIHSPPENSNLIFWMFDEVEYSNRNRSPEARNVVCVCGQNALPFLHIAHTFAVDVNLGDDKNTVTSSQAFGRAVRIGQVMITYH